MNKADLVTAVSTSSGVSKADADKTIDAVFEGITNALKGGDDVRLVGFGTFSVAQRAATTGRNPRTGEASSRTHSIPVINWWGRKPPPYFQDRRQQHRRKRRERQYFDW